MASRRMRRVAIGAAVLLLLGSGLVATTGLYVIVPPGLSGEAAHLARVMEIGPGASVADIGAGKGRLSRALAARVGPGGRVYATELPGDGLEALRRAADRQGPPHLQVVAAAPDSTALPDACCDAIVMRAVFHHLAAPERFAVSLRRGLRPGGRLAVIDFAPGGFWHLRTRPAGADSRRAGHGVTPDDVVAAVVPAGFRVRETVERWSGPLFLVVFETTPEQARQSR